MSKANPDKHIFPSDYVPLHGGHVWYTHGLWQFDRDVPFTDPDGLSPAKVPHDYIRVTELERATQNAIGLGMIYLDQMAAVLESMIDPNQHTQQEIDDAEQPVRDSLNSTTSLMFDFQWAIRRLKNRRAKQDLL